MKVDSDSPIVGEKYLYRLQILEHHLDTFGHVNNAVYLEILEEARWDFITKNGFGLERIMREQIGPVILEVNIKFKAELKNREMIEIESWSVDIKKNLLMNLQQIIRNEKGQISCIAHFTVGIMDLQQRRLIAPTEDWLKAVGYPVTPSLEKK